jgi:hypothetical protein
METGSLRLLIRQKLADGRLPRENVPRMWSGASNGGTCDACDEIIEGRQWWAEGIPVNGGRKDIRFHRECFNLWDDERHGHR